MSTVRLDIIRIDNTVNTPDRTEIIRRNITGTYKTINGVTTVTVTVMIDVTRDIDAQLPLFIDFNTSDSIVTMARFVNLFGKPIDMERDGVKYVLNKV